MSQVCHYCVWHQLTELGIVGTTEYTYQLCCHVQAYKLKIN